MIAGTVVMEDIILQFKHQVNGEVSLSVSDALTGQQGSVLCNAALFATAIGIALNPSGDAGNLSEEEYRELVEEVTPVPDELEEGEDSQLRWLP